MSQKRVVWILGSGFSRSLGGPLLWDFFSRPLEAKLLAALRVGTGPQSWRDDFAALIPALRAVYAGGLEETDRDVQFQRGPWSHAEEFLEYVDLANEHVPAAREIVKAALKSARGRYGVDEEHVGQLATDVRRYLAAACHFFIDPPDVIAASERWEPYRTWARNLEREDHVITFNYDVVPESVCRDLELFLCGPGAEGTQIPRAIHQGRCLIKLHGSVSQPIQEASGKSFAGNQADTWEMIGKGQRIAIAGPGPAKLAASKGMFRSHWELAHRLIAKATSIVFVGYRMPESDAFARTELCNAIAAAPDLENIRIVLGPRRDEHVDRLMRLLEWATQKRTSEGRRAKYNVATTHEPLYAQDFLAVFDRDKL